MRKGKLAMRQPRTELAAIEAEIAHLRSLAFDALRGRWRAVFGRPPPADLSNDLLGRMITAVLGAQSSARSFHTFHSRRGAGSRGARCVEARAAAIRRVL